MTPASIHFGRHTAIHQGRQCTLADAFLANPNRFKRNAPKPPALPTAAWINPPKKEIAPTHSPTIAH